MSQNLQTQAESGCTGALSAACADLPGRCEIALHVPGAITTRHLYYLTWFFFIDINIMPHYTVTLHALHNLSFSFIITFTFNNHKTIVEIHYNVGNHILSSSLIINNIFIHSLRSVYLSIFYSKASLQICEVYRFNKFYRHL